MNTINIPLTVDLTSDVTPHEEATTKIGNTSSASEVRHKKVFSLRRRESKKIRENVIITSYAYP